MVNTLGQLKDLISSQESEILPFGLSTPFSWRGYYGEVSFSIILSETAKSKILNKIELALNNEFIGYKGGEFYYDLSTRIHFESGISDWSDGGYVNNILFNLLLKINK